MCRRLYEVIEKNREQFASFLPFVESIKNYKFYRKYLKGIRHRLKSKEHIIFVIEVAGQIVGSIELVNIDMQIKKAEVGAFIDKSFSGKGITTRAMGWVCDYCFNHLGLNKISARINRNNYSSIKMVQKVGFVQEGIFREDDIIKGQYIDNVYFGIIKNDCEGE